MSSKAAENIKAEENRFSGISQYLRLGEAGINNTFIVALPD